MKLSKKMPFLRSQAGAEIWAIQWIETLSLQGLQKDFFLKEKVYEV